MEAILAVINSRSGVLAPSTEETGRLVCRKKEELRSWCRIDHALRLSQRRVREYIEDQAQKAKKNAGTFSHNYVLYLQVSIPFGYLSHSELD